MNISTCFIIFLQLKVFYIYNFFKVLGHLFLLCLFSSTLLILIFVHFLFTITTSFFLILFPLILFSFILLLLLLTLPLLKVCLQYLHIKADPSLLRVITCSTGPCKHG